MVYNKQLALRQQKKELVEKMYRRNHDVTPAEINAECQRRFKQSIGNRLLGPVLAALRGEAQKESRPRLRKTADVQENTQEVKLPREVYEAVEKLKAMTNGDPIFVSRARVAAEYELVKAMEAHNFSECRGVESKITFVQPAREVTVEIK